MATHSSIPAWEIPWTEEPGRLQSIGSQRIRQDLGIKQQQCMFFFNHNRKRERLKQIEESDINSEGRRKCQVELLTSSEW